jgi:steroid delta-isomerase-like uncharacterized protein
MKTTTGFAMALLVLASAAQAASPAVNRRVALEFFEQVLSQGHLERYADSHAPNFVAHGGRDATLEEDMAAAREQRKALPDMVVAVKHSVAENDLVAVHWTASGANTQAAAGLPGQGKKIQTNGMTIFRFKEGKIIEEWSVWDMYSALRQAGVLPDAH